MCISSELSTNKSIFLENGSLGRKKRGNGNINDTGWHRETPPFQVFMVTRKLRVKQIFVKRM